MMTAAEIVTQVRELAAKYPKAQYHKEEGSAYCDYEFGTVTNGPDTPGCIMGQAVRLLGVDTSGWGRGEIGPILEEEGYEFPADDSNMDWLLAVQQRQDSGVTWGEAIKLTDKTMEVTP